MKDQSTKPKNPFTQISWYKSSYLLLCPVFCCFYISFLDNQDKSDVLSLSLSLFISICCFNSVVTITGFSTTNNILLLLLLFTRPLPRDGGMAEDHGAPEAGQLPRVWTRGHKETKSRQRVSGAKSP